MAWALARQLKQPCFFILGTIFGVSDKVGALAVS
jgi:hypothetical protein